METSVTVSVLKERLRGFLADPSSEPDFREWFANTLRDAHKANDPELESLVHTVQRTFSDAAAAGLYNPEELAEALSALAVPDVDPLKYVTTSPWFVRMVNLGAESEQNWSKNHVSFSSKIFFGDDLSRPNPAFFVSVKPPETSQNVDSRETQNPFKAA